MDASQQDSGMYLPHKEETSWYNWTLPESRSQLSEKLPVTDSVSPPIPASPTIGAYRALAGLELNMPQARALVHTNVLYMCGVCTCVVTGTRMGVHTGARGGHQVSPLVTFFLIPRGSPLEPETSVSAWLSASELQGSFSPCPPRHHWGDKQVGPYLACFCECWEFKLRTSFICSQCS